MSETLTPLAIPAYDTAAAVDARLIASGVLRLSAPAGRRIGNASGPGQRLAPQAALGDLVLPAAGLFPLLKGVVVALWTFG